MRIRDATQWREGACHTLRQPGPFVCEVCPVQDEGLWLRSSAITQPDGTMIAMPLEDMSPLLPRDELPENMIIPLETAFGKVHPDVVARQVT